MVRESGDELVLVSNWDQDLGRLMREMAWLSFCSETHPHNTVRP